MRLWAGLAEPPEAATNCKRSLGTYLPTPASHRVVTLAHRASRPRAVLGMNQRGPAGEKRAHADCVN